MLSPAVKAVFHVTTQPIVVSHWATKLFFSCAFNTKQCAMQETAQRITVFFFPEYSSTWYLHHYSSLITNISSNIKLFADDCMMNITVIILPTFGATLVTHSHVNLGIKSMHPFQNT